MPFSSKLLQMGAAGAAGEKLYVEDVFSTYLYTGTGSNQTITNGIDLSGEGGLVWLKGRSVGYNHGLFDTIRGADYLLVSNNTDGSTSVSGIPANPWVTGFNSDGFGIGTNGSSNNNGTTYTSWTFRKAKKFFDVVTYTGTGSIRTVSHNLGSVPGCIIVKRTDTSSGDGWIVYHRGNTAAPETDYLLLNSAVATTDEAAVWNDTAPTSTVFTVGNFADVNANGGTYVAYLFAHDAGGFGDDGDQSVISCGSFTLDSNAAATVDLGWEPQFVLMKMSSDATNWVINDMMRGMPAAQTSQVLYPNISNAESSSIYYTSSPTATGFTTTNYANFTFGGGYAGGDKVIYIAIRRGPMKTPTDATTIFAPVVGSSLNTSFVADSSLIGYKPGGSGTYPLANARLIGNNYLETFSTDGELPFSVGSLYGAVQNGIGNSYFDSNFVGWIFKRAPGFHDVVCYTGNGSVSGQTLNHNLGVIPEFIIVKRRNNTAPWTVYHSFRDNTYFLQLNTDNALGQNSSQPPWKTPTSTTFGVGDGTYWNELNASSSTYIAYLFATLSGVSKVGSYTGTGTTLQVNCGFTAGARLVLIKRTNDTGNWYVWDSARGIVAGNDPYLLLNNNDAEVTNTDYIDTYSAGFEISSTAPAAINADGGTYIFLAIA